ncbi:unnamed protein product [Brassica rapa]|uniref:Dual specificity protein phosphatase 1 n=1 Tax=Brassica campestris TaxID=3711 RepID=A0A8D9DM99_BRACM|nr:unnamed protein product [Brassica rapa]
MHQPGIEPGSVPWQVELEKMEKVVDLFGVGEANTQKLLEGGNDLSQIQQGLFIGSVAEANNKDLLKASNVTHVLTIAVALSPPYPDDFVYKVIEVVDRSETDLTVYFDECYSFIDQAIESGGGVLVHCFMGISRSVTIVVAYLMRKHGIGFSKAMEIVKSRRPQALPNFGFVSQLQQFEKSIKVSGVLKHADLEIEISAASPCNPTRIDTIYVFFLLHAVHDEASSSVDNKEIGDQASIIGGVIEFIKEMQQLVQVLESKKRRKTLNRPSSPYDHQTVEPSILAATPNATTRMPFSQIENVMTTSTFKEVGACSNSHHANVEAKISGSNVVLRVVSWRNEGQLVKIISVLEKLSFQVLHLNISCMEESVLYFFVVKIGLECHLSLEELTLEVQKSFVPEAIV